MRHDQRDHGAELLRDAGKQLLRSIGVGEIRLDGGDGCAALPEQGADLPGCPPVAVPKADGRRTRTSK